MHLRVVTNQVIPFSKQNLFFFTLPSSGTLRLQEQKYRERNKKHEETHSSGLEDRDSIAMEVCRCGDRAQLLHFTTIDMGIPLTTARQIAEVLKHKVWRRARQPHGSGGAEYRDGWLSRHDVSAVPYHQAQCCLNPLGAAATADAPLVDAAGRWHSHRPRDGCVEAPHHSAGQLQDAPSPDAQCRYGYQL